MRRQEKTSKKQQIISEYLNGDSTFEELGIRYCVPWRTIQTWVRKHRNQQEICLQTGDKDTPAVEDLKLRILVLEEALKVVQEQTGVDFLKKTGAR